MSAAALTAVPAEGRDAAPASAGSRSSSCAR